MKAIRIHERGLPDVMYYEEIEAPLMGDDDVLIEISAIGINFIDTYQRSGLYQVPLPFTPGSEASGTILSVGGNVSGFMEGDSVAYSGILGAYAEQSVVPASRVVPLPSGLDTNLGAAAMLQGMTAHYLSQTTYSLSPSDTALIHAGAGGVGLLLIQMAKSLGTKVLTTVSTMEKAKLAIEAGADEVIQYTEEDVVEKVMDLTGGAGVQVVYDSVGQQTFDNSLKCLAPRGLLVLFGQSSGMVSAKSPNDLASGSYFLTRPRLDDHVRSRQELLWRAGEVFSWIQSGDLKIRIGQSYKLSEAAKAHKDLEGRKTTGKALLIP
jgi:NADPH2:quinone reductase